MIIVRPHHVGISVSDMDRSLQWYGKTMGFQKRSETYLEDSRMKIVYITNGEFEIELFEREGSDAVPAHDQDLGHSFSVQGYKHFAFEVGDVDQTWLQLLELGVEAVSEPATNQDLGVRYCFVRDPDGVLVEFLTPVQ